MKKFNFESFIMRNAEVSQLRGPAKGEEKRPILMGEEKREKQEKRKEKLKRSKKGTINEKRRRNNREENREK